MFSFGFAEAFVCFVGFLGGESAVSIAAQMKGKAIDEAAIPVRKNGQVYLTIILRFIWIELFFSRLQSRDGSHNYCLSCGVETKRY